MTTVCMNVLINMLLWNTLWTLLYYCIMMTLWNGNIFRFTGPLCAGNSPVPGEFPSQRPVTRSFDIFFDERPSKQSWAGDLRRHRAHYDVTVMYNHEPQRLILHLNDPSWPCYHNAVIVQDEVDAGITGIWLYTGCIHLTSSIHHCSVIYTPVVFIYLLALSLICPVWCIFMREYIDIGTAVNIFQNWGQSKRWSVWWGYATILWKNYIVKQHKLFGSEKVGGLWVVHKLYGTDWGITSAKYDIFQKY